MPKPRPAALAPMRAAMGCGRYSVLLLATILLVARPAATSVARATVAGPQPYYLSLGDSLAYGQQAGGAGSSNGYSDDLFAALQPLGTTTLVNMGCPSETSTTFINGGCPYANLVKYAHTGSRLSAALSFIQQHPGQVSPVTLDLGINDMKGLYNATTCTLASAQTITKALSTYDANMNGILSQLQAALHGTGDLLVMTNYFAQQNQCPNLLSLAQSFNAHLVADAQQYGAQVAPVFDAFGGAATPNPNLCADTWICSSYQDIHPTTQGYAAIAATFEQAAGYGAAAAPTATPIAPTATPLPGRPLSGSYSGSIAAAGGSDSYTFTPGASGPATVGSCAITNGYNFDVYVYDAASGATLASAASPSTCEALSVLPPYRGLFRLREVATSGSGVYSGTISTDGPVAAPSATPTPTATPSPSPTNTPSPSPTSTSTSTQTSTPTSTAIRTVTPTSMATPSDTATAIDTATPTATDTATSTPPGATITSTATPSDTPATTSTAMPTATMTPTATPSDTVMPTATPTDTGTATPTAMPAATATPTAMPAATATPTPTDTATATATDTATAMTPTNTVAPTATPTATSTATPTLVPTSTPTTMPTSTPTSVPTAMPTATAGPPASGTYSGSIAAVGGADSFTFTAPQSGPDTVGSCGISNGDNYDVYLYDSGGQLLAKGTTSSYCDWATAPVSAGQRYTVTTVAVVGTGGYRAAWAINGAPVTWVVHGTITTSGSSTSFSFPILLPAPIAMSSCGPSGTNYDLALNNASGVTLASAATPSTCEALSYTPKARALFRAIESSASGTGPYTLSITTS